MGWLESVTVIVTVFVPTALCCGEPEMTPLAAPIASPAGKPLAEKVYGVTPPDTAIVPP